MWSLLSYIVIMLPIVLEGFPISSSGHMQLLAQWIQCNYGIDILALFPALLDHLLHGPVALVIALFFYHHWYPLLINFKRAWRIIITMLLLGFITESATGCWYGMFSLIGTAWFPLSLGFAITALLLSSLRWCAEDGHTRWNIPNALILGSAQGLALLPGVSRFGATFVTARWLGFSKRRAFELSFLIEWPISVAGFAKGLCDIVRHQEQRALMPPLTPFLFSIFFAMLGAVVGFYIIERMIAKDTVWHFGIYMVVITIVSVTICR